jgi:hypothetical protein
MKAELTLELLITQAKLFCSQISETPQPTLYGVTDGKAVGTLVEQAFKTHLAEQYVFRMGSSATGIDLPDSHILTDIKVTSIRQPQSSCPFRDARQKIFGLGYNLLVFVYDKSDDPTTQTALLRFVSCTFIAQERTADYTTTYRIRQMVEDGANTEDLVAYLLDKNIPADEVTLQALAEQILKAPPLQGFLTISNALQWRLQYQRVVELNQTVEGITPIIQRHEAL